MHRLQSFRVRARARARRVGITILNGRAWLRRESKTDARVMDDLYSIVASMGIRGALLVRVIRTERNINRPGWRL